MTDPDRLGARAAAMIEELCAISAEPGRLVRLYLTPEHRRAADLVARWMREAGLAAGEDALGTVRGRWGGGRRLLIGSHLDSVIDAGRYDGPLGVVAGILAAEQVVRSGRQLPFGIDVLAFGDEEGSRFPSTLSSSAACAGVFDDAMLSLADRDGVPMAEALRAYGKSPAEIPAAAYGRADAAAYVEVHIEQGPVLESENEPLGVVTGIVGASRLRVTVTGEAGHAGTVPMDLRRDALAGAAELVLAVERIVRTHHDDRMVGTVGRIEAAPGATNVTPGGPPPRSTCARRPTGSAAPRSPRSRPRPSASWRRAGSRSRWSRSTRWRRRPARRPCRSCSSNQCPRSATGRCACRPAPATTAR
ncbi:MAG: hydantoinase/carbamoylase family amidase [Xanthobacteraceae bacterium]|nr:hydantoinase/carbamoylase family amidase [Xanthobacteraceae bacterium]